MPNLHNVRAQGSFPTSQICTRTDGLLLLKKRLPESLESAITGWPIRMVKPPVELVMTLLAAVWPLLKLPTTQAVWWNIPDVSHSTRVHDRSCHVVMSPIRDASARAIWHLPKDNVAAVDEKVEARVDDN